MLFRSGGERGCEGVVAVKLRQIDQNMFLLETYSQKRSVSKLFLEGVSFWRDFASGVSECPASWTRGSS